MPPHRDPQQQKKTAVDRTDHIKRNSFTPGNAHYASLSQQAWRDLKLHPLLTEKPENAISIDLMPDVVFGPHVFPRGMVLTVERDTPARLVLGHVPDLYGVVAGCRLACPIGSNDPNAYRRYQEKIQHVIDTYFTKHASERWLMDHSMMHEIHEKLKSNPPPPYVQMGRVGCSLSIVKRPSAPGHEEYMVVLKNYCHKTSEAIHRAVYERSEANFTIGDLGTMEGGLLLRKAFVRQQAMLSYLLLDLFELNEYVTDYIPSPIERSCFYKERGFGETQDEIAASAERRRLRIEEIEEEEEARAEKNLAGIF